MNTHSRITGLLLCSTLLLPNVAWCWDDGSYRSQANPSGYSGYGGSFDNFKGSSNSGSTNNNYDHYDRHDRNDKPKETPQEYQYRKLGEYNQAKVDQQVESARQKAEYEQEKYRMQAEYQLQSLQK